MGLAENVAHAEQRPERVREELLKHPRDEREREITDTLVELLIAI
ncbi:hypothetical protein ABZW11_21490 [Nonomuraea sp. NPDC004580]